VPLVIIGEVPGDTPVRHDKKLHEAEEGVSVAVARLPLVVDNLLHGYSGHDAQCLELDLDEGQSIDEDDDVVAFGLSSLY